MKTGILFDMDGTLWNSTRQVAMAWSSITVPALGKSVTEKDMYRVMGMPMDKLAHALFPGHPLSELSPLMEKSYEVENEYLAAHGAYLYPGLIKTLETLAQSFPLFIVSNCQQGYIETFLTYYHLGHLFEDHICFGDNNLQKGENIALMIDRHQLGRSFYVGDIQADYEAALEGGAEFIYAAYGFGTVTADVPAIQSFSGLPALLAKLINKPVANQFDK